MDSVTSLSLKARNNLRSVIPYIDNEPARKDLAEAYLKDWDAWAGACEHQRSISQWCQSFIFLIIPPLIGALYLVFISSKKLDRLFAKLQTSQKDYYAYVEKHGGSAVERELLRRVLEGRQP